MLPEAKFAVLKYVQFFTCSHVTNQANVAFSYRIGGAILTNELEDLALSLSFLNRLGLFPVVLHGAGPQL